MKVKKSNGYFKVYTSILVSLKDLIDSFKVKESL